MTNRPRCRHAPIARPVPTMSNDPRPAKPPLPLLKRSKSGTVAATRRERESVELGRKPAETGRSGTIAAVRPPPAVLVPRPTNVLRRLDPTYTPDHGSDSWEPRGTMVGGSYRDSMPTIPSPEVLESRLLAELAESVPAPAAAAAAEAELEPRARAHFEPAHAPSVRVSPIIELEKAVAVIVDPLAIASGPTEDPEPLEDYPSASMLLLAASKTVAAPEAVPLAPDVRAPEVEADAAVGEACSVSGANELEPEVSERSRITRPPARRRRRRRPLRALLLVAGVLAGVAGAGWYRYPAACEQGWQRARAEFSVLGSALEHQWSAALGALGR